MIQKAQNYSELLAFLSEFRIELLSILRITHDVLTYSELLSIFRITQRIHLSRGRAERRARNVSHLDRPWGVLSAYHALILVGPCPPPMGIQSYSLYRHVDSLQLDELSENSAKVIPESVSNQHQINNQPKRFNRYTKQPLSAFP